MADKSMSANIMAFRLILSARYPLRTLITSDTTGCISSVFRICMVVALPNESRGSLYAVIPFVAIPNRNNAIYKLRIAFFRSFSGNTIVVSVFFGAVSFDACAGFLTLLRNNSEIRNVPAPIPMAATYKLLQLYPWISISWLRSAGINIVAAAATPAEIPRTVALLCSGISSAI